MELKDYNMLIQTLRFQRIILDGIESPPSLEDIELFMDGIILDGIESLNLSISSILYSLVSIILDGIERGGQHNLVILDFEDR